MSTLKPLRLLLPAFTVIRTALNTLHRMAYPFLGVFARGLGVKVETMAGLVANRALISAFVPLVFPLIEPRGRKFGMLLGMFTFLFGVSLVVFWPTFPSLAAAFILATIGKYIFDPSMQAWLSDRVPYERRGLTIALTEIGWSAAFIVGVPLVGFLLARWGWLSPFPLFAILALFSILLLTLSLPPEKSESRRTGGFFTNFRSVLTSPVALTGLSIGLFASAANEVVNLMFGIWLEDSFALKLAALGAASAVIGVSELAAELLVAGFADRLGKARAIALGLLANIVVALSLPWVGRTTAGALTGLFLFYLTFEFMLVSDIPLMTELQPGGRATLMAFNTAGISLGRAMGAVLAPLLYNISFISVACGAGIFNLLALLAVLKLRKTIR